MLFFFSNKRFWGFCCCFSSSSLYFHVHHQPRQQHATTSADLFFWQHRLDRAPPFSGSVITTYAQTAKYSRWAICNQRSPPGEFDSTGNSLTHGTFREFSVCFVSCVFFSPLLFAGRRERETGKIHQGKNKQTMCLR